MESGKAYKKGFLPYALAAFLIGLVGGFSTLLGPSFVQDIGIAYSNTTWTALAQAISTAACAPILGKVGDLIGRRITLLLGIAVFTFGNILSALANSLVFMLISRFVVGIGTAAMPPVIMAYIVTSFPRDQVAKGFYAYPPDRAHGSDFWNLHPALHCGFRLWRRIFQCVLPHESCPADQSGSCRGKLRRLV